jgi:hypothetical protein
LCFVLHFVGVTAKRAVGSTLGPEWIQDSKKAFCLSISVDTTAGSLFAFASNCPGPRIPNSSAFYCQNFGAAVSSDYCWNDEDAAASSAPGDRSVVVVVDPLAVSRRLLFDDPCASQL